MTIKRITISVPAELAAKAKKAAGAEPVSAWIAKLIEEHLTDAELERRWREFYREVAPTKADIRAADDRFERLVGAQRDKGKVKRKKRAA